MHPFFPRFSQHQCQSGIEFNFIRHSSALILEPFITIKCETRKGHKYKESKLKQKVKIFTHGIVFTYPLLQSIKNIHYFLKPRILLWWLDGEASCGPSGWPSQKHSVSGVYFQTEEKVWTNTHWAMDFIHCWLLSTNIFSVFFCGTRKLAHSNYLQMLHPSRKVLKTVIFWYKKN